MIKHLSRTDRGRRPCIDRWLWAAICLLLVISMSGCATLRSPAAMKSEAQAAYSAERYAEAAQAWRRYLDARPEDAQGWYRLGNAEARIGNLVAAEHAFRRVLELDPEMARARHNLGLVQIQLGVTAMLEARRSLPEVDAAAADTMRYLACLMETFMGHPEPSTCNPGAAAADGPAQEGK